MAQAKPPLPFPRDPFLLIDEDLFSDADPLSEESAESVRQHCYAALRDIFKMVPHSRQVPLYADILAALIDASTDPRDLMEVFARCYAAERKSRHA